MEKEVALIFKNAKINIAKVRTEAGDSVETKYIVTIGDLEQEKYLSIILERYGLDHLINAIKYISG